MQQSMHVTVRILQRCDHLYASSWMQCDHERLRPRETVLKWHAHALRVTTAQPLCGNGHEQTNGKRSMYPYLNARSQRSATLQAPRTWQHVVNRRSRSDWGKQADPECSWDVKMLSCVKMARRLRGEHAKSSATSQAPQASYNGMLELVARRLRQLS